MLGLTPKVVVMLPGSFASRMDSAWHNRVRRNVSDALKAKVATDDTAISEAEVIVQIGSKREHLLRDGRVQYYPKCNLDMPGGFVLPKALRAWLDEVLDVIADAVLDSFGGDRSLLTDTEIEWKFGTSSRTGNEDEAERKTRLGR